jgi:hypothetical protein
MIPRFRDMAPLLPACALEGLIDNARRNTDEGDTSSRSDDEFEFLLKHALSTTREPADGGKVWQQIARKMRGPFGTPALEGPGCTTLEQVLMSSGGRVQLAPFVLGSPTHGEKPPGPRGTECVWEMLRCVSSTTAPKGYSWLFA